MKQKKILRFIICSILCISKTTAQDLVHWNYSVRPVNAKEYELHMAAVIDEPWHIYSQTQPKEAIAFPTKIVFSKNPVITLVGKAKEDGKKKKYEDKAAGIVQYQYETKVDFVQKIQVKSKIKTNVTGTITFQTCNEERCLPQKTVLFNISIQ